MQVNNSKKTAIIIGAGPAGLTAAYELLDKTDIIPVILEKTCDIGGISRTLTYKGNRIDIGGHRFFSKSDRIMDWWCNILPQQGAPARDDQLLGRTVPLATSSLHRFLTSRDTVSVSAPDPELTDMVMLVRNRLSRIFFLRKFFSYPVTLSWDTLRNLGAWRIVKIGASYLNASLFPIRKEGSLEDFFINRFGRELYGTFFKDYTEKVWGVACSAIKPEWGAQRIKGLSVTTTLLHAARKIFWQGDKVGPKKVETSLIEQFLYPKLGPGQMWEEVARQVESAGGQLLTALEVVEVETKGKSITAVVTRDENGRLSRYEGDYFFSTMPVSELSVAMGTAVPLPVREAANGLRYRDFITVGLLLKELKISNSTSTKTLNNLVPDNWIYIQEREVRLGRLQIFNNWSPYLVADPDTVWVGLEYFCSEGDALWSMEDEQFIKFAIQELASIEIINPADVLDATVIRVPKAYPAYFGSYDDFGKIREFMDSFENLFLIGRNGMHRYNNADHSMLTAMEAVGNIITGRTDKGNIWDINAEDDYHELKK